MLEQCRNIFFNCVRVTLFSIKANCNPFDQTLSVNYGVLNVGQILVIEVKFVAYQAMETRTLTYLGNAELKKLNC
jgi:hypothetical protein